jgi:hypothetical protein
MVDDGSIVTVALGVITEPPPTTTTTTTTAAP